MRQFLRIMFIVVLLAGATGCDGCGGGSSSTAPTADARSPGQYFSEQQAATMTPNGKIMTDSVTERDGKIEYITEDGKRWRVSYSKRADGTYQYGTPDEVAP